jgi:hypothetical protein
MVSYFRMMRYWGTDPYQEPQMNSRPWHAKSSKNAPLLAAICMLAACSEGASSSGGTAGNGGGTSTTGAGGALEGGGGSGSGGSTASHTGGAMSQGGSTIRANGGSGSGGLVGSGGATINSGGGMTGHGGATSSSSSGGATGSGGLTASGGAAGGGGATFSGGVGTGGRTSAGGATGSGGVGTGGRTSAGGATGSGTGGSTAAGGATGSGGSGATCGATPNPIPFNCQFAWGLNGVNPTTYPYVQFISNWAGYNIQANGTFSSCDQCGWLKNTMANATQVPVLIAYFIGYWGHVNGLVDGNQCPASNPNCPNLTNGMGALLLGVANAACPSGVICSNNLMVKAYAWYAAQVYANYKKPIIWWMEGDFVQYSPEGSQTVPLSWDQTGQLAAQITNAIKCNDPAAVVTWNYSTWISTTQRDSYFNAINTNVAKLGTSYEMVFTSGQGNSASAGTGTTWDQLYTAAGNKPVMSDESFGLSVAGDTWANQTAATINARIAQHFVGIDVTTSTVPSYLQTNLTSSLAPSALNTTCP